MAPSPSKDKPRGFAQTLTSAVCSGASALGCAAAGSVGGNGPQRAACCCALCSPAASICNLFNNASPTHGSGSGGDGDVEEQLLPGATAQPRRWAPQAANAAALTCLAVLAIAALGLNAASFM